MCNAVEIQLPSTLRWGSHERVHTPTHTPVANGVQSNGCGCGQAAIKT